MKKVLLLLALGVSTLGFSQPADDYAGFRARKQSIVLTTGITMKYIDAGNAAGVPVILLHGSSDTGRSFQATMEELARTNGGLRLIAPDLRGHGETSLPDAAACANAPEQCFAPADFAADVLALMNQQRIAKAHLVGHSMGSVVAQELALHHPDRVSSLVLIGTFVDGKACRAIHDFLQATVIDGQFRPAFEKRGSGQWPRDAYAITPRQLGSGVTGFLKENWVAEMGTKRELLDAIYRETIDVPVGTWIGMVKALGTVDNRAAMADLKVPTLVLHAIQDVLVPEPDQQSVKAALREAARRHGTPVTYKTYGRIPLPASGQQESDLGHNLQWAAPGQVAADVSAFLKTGSPLVNNTYLDPQDAHRVRTAEGQANLVRYGGQK